MTLRHKVRAKMDAMELRIIMASFWAGIGEITIRIVTHIEMFGYLGVGMTLYALVHYAQLKVYNMKRNKKGDC